MAILVTGGAGYIGSHFVKMMIQNDHDLVVIDNLSRGTRKAVPHSVTFEKIDLLDYDRLLKSVSKYQIDSVVHFAAFAYVGESVENPQLYFNNNIVGSLNLLNVTKELGIKKFIFSSTCSVYGNPQKIPISENEIPNPINPYAKSKLAIEHMLQSYDDAYEMKYVSLRYFNAAGADRSGEIGESHDPEPHLIPLVLETALGNRDKISINGDDYDTNDGTCVRDYIHVNDLADAHIKALEYLSKSNKSAIFNLGTGKGFSVKEIVDLSKQITGREIVTEIVSRRIGDPAILVADNSKVKKVLGWKTRYNMEDIIKSAWNWHQNRKY